MTDEINDEMTDEDEDMADGRCEECGGDEFITKPNAYDIYEYSDGQFCFVESTLIDDEFKLYCRECGEEVKPLPGEMEEDGDELED